MMKELLDEFICTISVNDNKIDVTYTHPTYSHSGVCVYERHITKGTNKPITQTIHILRECDMGDIIEYINQTRGLTDKDFNEINMLIREHSLSKVDTL
jgi:hypothetical protein